MHTLLFLDPGHFHAALTLRIPNPRVASDIHVYAEDGPERDAFIALVRSFNERADEPTQWNIHVHGGADPLARLIDERRGNAVILAGRNNSKLSAIRALHDAGFNALVDKPWITASASLPDLTAATAGPPLAVDIMTNRQDTTARLRQRIVATEPVFGAFADSAEIPAIEFGSIHHLYKIVNGKPLKRPVWYYDVNVQGDGLVDIQSHMTDQAQWLVDPDDTAAFERDFVIDAAKRWSTEVPLTLFAESTGSDNFPESLSDRIADGVLQLACNGQIDYRLKGVRMRQRAEWGQREPVGGGDVHTAIVRGTGCEIVVRDGAMHLSGDASLEARISDALTGWRETFPGLAIKRSDIGFELTIPPDLRVSHEAQFPIVLDRFLDRIDTADWPEHRARRIRNRYTLIAKARDLA